MMMPSTVAEWGLEFGIRGLVIFIAFMVAWRIQPKTMIVYSRCVSLPVLLGIASFGWSNYLGNMFFISGGIDSGFGAHHELARGGIILAEGALFSLILLFWKRFKPARIETHLEPPRPVEPSSAGAPEGR